MVITNLNTGEPQRHYDCTPDTCVELCMAKIEGLLRTALLDTEENKARMGGERELLYLMNGYCNLITKIRGIEKHEN